MSVNFGRTNNFKFNFYAPDLPNVEKVELAFLKKETKDSIYIKYPLGSSQRTKDNLIKYRQTLIEQIDTNNKYTLIKIDGEYSLPYDLNGGQSAQLIKKNAGKNYVFLVTYKNGTQEAFPDYDDTQFQPKDTFWGSQVINHSLFEWGNDKIEKKQKPDINKLIIQEVHVGTYKPDSSYSKNRFNNILTTGTYNSLSSELRNLKNRGINTIELMPLHEFPGHIGWGYDPIHFSAPENTYGTPTDLKNLIKTAHKNGMKVILDIVVNHFGPEDEGNFFGKLAKNTFYDTEAFDALPSHEKYGQIPNYKNNRVKQLFNNMMETWVEDYHFDGFRVDSSHLIDNEFWKNFIGPLQEKYKHVLFIAEDHGSNRHQTTKKVSNNGLGHDMRWGNDEASILAKIFQIKDFLKNKGNAEDFESVMYHGTHKGNLNDRPNDPYNIKVFHNSHDITANSIWDKALKIDLGGRGYRPNQWKQKLNRPVSPKQVQMFSTWKYLLPRVPMSFMGEEFNASSNFHYFADYFTPEMRQERTTERSWQTKHPIFSYKTFNDSKLNLKEQDKNKVYTQKYKDTIDFRLNTPGIHQGLREQLGNFAEYAVNHHLITNNVIPLLRQKMNGGKDTYIIANNNPESKKFWIMFPNYPGMPQSVTGWKEVINSESGKVKENKQTVTKIGKTGDENHYAEIELPSYTWAAFQPKD